MLNEWMNDTQYGTSRGKPTTVKAKYKGIYHFQLHQNQAVDHIVRHLAKNKQLQIEVSDPQRATDFPQKGSILLSPYLDFLRDQESLFGDVVKIFWDL